MAGYDYVLYRQIQNCKEKYYRQHHEGLCFPNAVSLLLESGEILHGKPQKPDFLSWDLQNTEDFQELIGCIPVAIKELEEWNTTIPLVNHAMHLYPKRETHILLESCYTTQGLSFTDFFTVIYVMHGSCTLHLKDEIHPLETGCLCILPPRTPFFVFSKKEDIVINIQAKESSFLSNFSLLLQYDNVLTSFFRHALLEDYTECKYFVLPPDKKIRLLIQNLFAEYTTDDPYSGTAFNNFLQIFYLSIIRSTETTYQYYSAQERTPAAVLMPAILEYITQNYHDLTLQSLSDHFHYDSTYMSYIVKHVTGRSYRSILSELKLGEAKKLLDTTSLSIAAVAKKAGFGSADALSYAMKHTLGFTPAAYRKQRNQKSSS